MAECFPVKKCTTFGGQHGGNEDPADSGPKNGGSMPGGNGGHGIVMVVSCMLCDVVVAEFPPDEDAAGEGDIKYFCFCYKV